MSAAHWIGPRLFLGSIVIGKIEPQVATPGAGKSWAGFSLLPGARMVLGPFSNEETAREMVMKSAQSRVKAMFGAGIETTATAVRDGRSLRVTTRAIWRAGVWTCDRPVDAHAMFRDLGEALGFNPEESPQPDPDAKSSEHRGTPARTH